MFRCLFIIPHIRDKLFIIWTSKFESLLFNERYLYESLDTVVQRFLDVEV